MTHTFREDDERNHKPTTSGIKFSARCVICKALLAPSSELVGRTCLSFACQQALARRKREGFGQKQCKYCFSSLSVHMVVKGGLCDDRNCQELERNQRLQRDALRREQALLQQIDEWRSALGITKESSIHLFQIPASERPILPLPTDNERREQLHQHLLSLFEELAQEPETAPPSAEPESQEESTHPDELSLTKSDESHAIAEQANTSPEPSPDEANGDGFPLALLAATCRTCQGFCCLRGGEQAYLTTQTIQRLQREQPQLDKSSIIQGYMQAIPDRVSEGSCIYHGEAGCGLPSTWRADTCNNYFCGPVHKLLSHPVSQGQEFVAVAMSQSEIMRVARFDEDHYAQLHPKQSAEEMKAQSTESTEG